MPMLPQFKIAQMSRRMSDIDRLNLQYSKDIKGIAGEFEGDYAIYKKGVDAKMADYGKKFELYKQQDAVYQNDLNAYKKRMSDYQAMLEDIRNNPLEKVNAGVSKVRGNTIFDVNGQKITSLAAAQAGYTVIGDELFRKRDIPKFTEAAPVAPDVPAVPKIDKYDDSKFKAKSAATDMVFRREVGERKDARMTAVSRKSARPLLSGV